MDNDTKHVLTVLCLVGCFGAGYFICKTENREALKLSEKFGIFTQIDNAIDGKADISFENEKKAVKAAVNAYYAESDDRYFYYSDDGAKDDSETEKNNYDYVNTYKIMDNIVYINSSDFLIEGTQGFARFFMDNPESDNEGFIIDLRENTGGFTDNSVGILGYFIEPQKVAEYHYSNGKTKDIKITKNNKKTDKKVVILVNEHTASAAEIFVASMKQFYNSEVITIGTTTKGKGSFQEYEYLSNNERFKYTAGRYTVGTWQCYDGIGIDPDIKLEMQYDPDIICTEDDLQLNKAVELFNN